jgi:catechol 2,3-dioxygenase-like lactoylglutathione lyase family enzyme
VNGKAVRVHHVNIAVLEDGFDEEARFLADVIGLRHLKPGIETPPTAKWFDVGDGAQIHVSLDPNHRAGDMAHVALVLGDAIPATESRLVERGIEYKAIDDDTGRRLFCKDPAGNLWELRET